MPSDPVRSRQEFIAARTTYLSSPTTPEVLAEVIRGFELAQALDATNRDAASYLAYAQRDLNGLVRKSRGLLGAGRTRGRNTAAGSKDDILAAYETDEEANSEEDSELYGSEEEAEAPPWDPATKPAATEEATWEEA